MMTIGRYTRHCFEDRVFQSIMSAAINGPSWQLICHAMVAQGVPTVFEEFHSSTAVCESDTTACSCGVTSYTPYQIRFV
jgi:hypothetical protein